MNIKKYDIAKEFKRGIIARIEYRACNWNEESQAFNDGWSWANEHLIGLINGDFIPGRSCNALYGTRSPRRLRVMHPTWDIEPHYDAGKYLYWRTLHASGKHDAKKLQLESLPYPKPASTASL